MFGQVVTLFELRAFRNAYLVRGVLVWVFIRIALAFNGAINPAAGTQALDPAPLAEIGTIAVVALVVRWDARRRAEDILLGNLGIPAWTIALMATPAALMLELLVP